MSRKDLRRIRNLVFGIGLLAGSALAQAPVGLSIDTLSPGPAIPEDFNGASFGAISLKSSSSGYFFDSTDTQAVTLFQQLGIKCLRIGGTSVDTNTSGYTPAPADIDALFRFAAAAGVKVIYSVRLMNGDADQDASLASYVWNNHRQYLDCFAIGNEPNLYGNRDPDITNYSSYLAKWRTFAAVITNAVPEAVFGGPDNDTGGTSWGTSFANDELGSGIVTSIFFHYYVGGGSAGKTIQQLIDALLSSGWVTANYPARYGISGAVVSAG